MKIRNGFVSNSSSSSFVLVGFTVDSNMFNKIDYLQKLFDITDLPENIEENEDEISDLFYNATKRQDISVKTHTEAGAPFEKHLIGVTIAEGDDCNYINSGEFDFEELQQKAVKISEKLGIECPKIKIFVGERAC